MSDAKNSLKSNFVSRFGTNMQRVRAMANKHPSNMSPYDRLALTLHRMPDDELKRHAETTRSEMEKSWAQSILQCREMGEHEQLK